MKYWLVAIGAAIALGGAQPASAQATPPPVAIPSPDQTEKMQRWLAESAEWNIAVSEVLQTRIERIQAYTLTTGQLVQRVNGGDRAGAKAWIEGWLANQRVEMAAERARLDALAAEPPGLPAALRDGEGAAVRASYVEFRVNVDAFLRRTDEDLTQFNGLLLAAASGRQQDLMAVLNGMMALNAAAVDSEIVLLRSMQGKPGEPQHHLITAMLESDYAISAWMRNFSATLLGKTADTPAAVAEMRRRVQAAMVQADELTAAAQLTRIQAMSIEDPAMRQVSIDAMDSYVRSAEVEREIAQLLGRLADRAAAGDMAGQVGLSQSLETLGRRRMDLQQERADMIVGLGS